MKGKRELILQSVLELIMEQGMNGLKVSSIAKKADIGKGTVYEYFTSKEDLFIGTIEYGIGQMLTMIETKLADTTSFKDSFDSVVDCVFEVTSKGPFLSLFSDSTNMPFSKDTICKMEAVMQTAMKSFIEIFSTIIAKGVNEGIIRQQENPDYIRAILLIVTNMTMQRIHFGTGNITDLKKFYYEACLKLFA